MAEFLIQALPPGGAARPQTHRVQAADAQAAMAQLGLSPERVLHVQALPAAARAGGPPGTRHAVARPWPLRPAQAPARPLDARLFAQELAVLLDAGIALLEALETLGEKDPATAAALAGALAALREGQPLSQALARVPGGLDALFIPLVAASERSGTLAHTLRHHAAYLAWAEALRAKLVAASVYPLMLVAAGGAVVMFLLLYVLPRFAGVFEGLQGDLPAASVALLQLGQLAAAHPQASLALAAAVPAGAWLAVRQPAVRRALLALLWRLPGLGARLRTLALARLYRALGLLFGAGVPALEALQLARGVLPVALQPALAAATQQVAQGERLSQALQIQALATPVALRMLRVGEGSGALAPMLERAAAFHDEELARLTELLTRTINPLLMLVMGTLIGGIVVLMYLPIFTLVEQVG